MHYLVVTECQVPMPMRQEFVGAVQRWEEQAGAMEGAPDVHAVYLDSDDPGKVLIVTQFNSKRDAERFKETGLMDDFHAGLLRCTAAPPSLRTYDLFYATGPGDRRVIFGQDA
ncbi:MAG: hypothetical protein QNJ89_09260 [Acidimicrobiia bacterium]|nr:hypothetical protein [Acidimicrobiia bacterium]